MQEYEIENQENTDNTNKADTKAIQEKLNSNTKLSSFDKSGSKERVSRVIDRENKP